MREPYSTGRIRVASPLAPFGHRCLPQRFRSISANLTSMPATSPCAEMKFLELRPYVVSSIGIFGVLRTDIRMDAVINFRPLEPNGARRGYHRADSTILGNGVHLRASPRPNASF